MWFLVRMVFWLSLIIALLPIALLRQETSVSKVWGSRLPIRCERGGHRQTSILCTATRGLRCRLRSNRSVRTKGGKRREIALSVFKREKGQG